MARTPNVAPPAFHRLLLQLTAIALSAAAALDSGEQVDGVYDRLLPTILSRLGEIRRVLVPVGEDTMAEAMFHAASYYIPVDAESDRCRNHSSLTFQSFLDQEIWALKMMDASSKLPVGLLDGNVMDLGSYDECLSLEAPDGLFRGLHCVVETRGVLPGLERALNPKQRPFVPSVPRSLTFSVCVPSSCSARDVKVHMDVALNSVNATAILTDDNCSSRVPAPWLKRELAAMCLITVIVSSIILSTLYDSICMQDKSGGAPLLGSSFSLRRNVARMLDTRQAPEALPCLNGLRVIAMAWIIMGHRFLNMLSFPLLRGKNAFEMFPTLPIAPILNAQLAVEVFFLLTGVLLSYNFLRYRRQGKTFNFMQFYLRRYIRLTPSLVAMMVLYGTVIVHVTEGPLWKRFFAPFQIDCLAHWWTNLVYANNYLNPHDICVSQTWYLSVDFQLYLLSPLVLLPLCRRPKLGLGLAAGLAVLSSAAAVANALRLDLKAGGFIILDRRTEQAQTSDYIVTHLRASSFLMGLALGYLLFRIKQGEIVLKLSKPTVVAGWIASALLVLGSVLSVTVFHQPGYAPSPWIDSLYIVFHRHVFSLGIAWIIFACIAGYGGFVDEFLSWSAFTPLARLTYCAYLTHQLVQMMDTHTQRSAYSLNWSNMFYHFGGDLTLGYLSAAALHLAVEAPFAAIADRIFSPGKKSSISPKTLEKSEKISDCDSTSKCDNIRTLPFDSCDSN